MGNVFFISDLHLGHNSIIKWRLHPTETRPFESVEEHDELIVDTWNRCVGKRDVVWVLGDILFSSSSAKHLPRLRGIKHLVLGNHDLNMRSQLLGHFGKIAGSVAYKNYYLLTHIPVHPRSVRPRHWFNIHGHTHLRGGPLGDEYLNVCVEALDFEPIAWEKVQSILEERLSNLTFKEIVGASV